MSCHKINDNKIAELEEYNIFGEWITCIDTYKSKFQSASPFGNVVINDFLRSDIAEKVFKSFPSNYEEWHNYNNPLEVKCAYDDIDNMDKSIQKVFLALSTQYAINKFSYITGIENLEYDPCLHGAGLHAHPRNGRLQLHLDYEKHPILIDKERRLNIILFLTKDWKKEWNGSNQLWNQNLTKAEVCTEVKFNTAIIFQTNNISWHGLPDKIQCPENVFRKSLAYYYISDLVSKAEEDKIGNNGTGHRAKATYIQHPYTPHNEKLEKLIKIRPFRRIEQSDMDEIWPDWCPETD